MGVDQAGHDGGAGGVEGDQPPDAGVGSAGVGLSPDRGDAVPFEEDGGRDGSRAGAVDEHAAGNQDGPHRHTSREAAWSTSGVETNDASSRPSRSARKPPRIVAVLVAHALWSPGRGFCFWAEDSRLVGRARRDDDDDPFGLRRHSFAVATDGLGAFLGLGPNRPPGRQRSG